MQPTAIIRHRKERLAKCSLRGLEPRPDLHFHRYPDRMDDLPDLTGWINLTVDAPPLSPDDLDRPILLIDGTWRLADRIAQAMAPQLTKTIDRSIPPGFVTAYPRTQTACPDPDRGLASVEALYLAYRLTGRPTEGLLDHYHWADLFLTKNKEPLAMIAP